MLTVWMSSEGAAVSSVLQSKWQTLYRRYRLVSMHTKIWLLANGVVWALGPTVTQLLLMASFNETHVQPNLGGAVWLGYLCMGAVPMSLAFLMHGFVTSTDLLATMLQCWSLLMIFFVPMANSSWTYREITSSTAVMDSLVGTLVPGLVSLFTVISFVIILLRNSGADNAHIQHEKQEMMLQRNIARYALIHALHDTQTLRANLERQTLYESFMDSQRLVFDEIDQFAQRQERMACHWDVLTSQLANVDSAFSAGRFVGEEAASQYITTLMNKRSERKKERRAAAAATSTEPPSSHLTVPGQKPSNELLTLNPHTVKVAQLLKHRVLSEWLRYACRLGGSEENWYFLVALDAFERLPDSLSTHRLDDAWNLYQLFIDSKGPLHINIGADLVQRIHARLDAAVQETPPHLFDGARQEVIQLLQTNNIAPLCKQPAFVKAWQYVQAMASNGSS